MSKRLTAIGVEAIKAKAERFEVVDGTSGLRLIVQPGGSKSWAIRYRRPGTRTTAKYTIGPWPAVSLADARAKATAALVEVERGADPAQARIDVKAAAEIAAGDTLRAVAEAHLQFEQAKPPGKRLRTIDQRASTLQRLIYPTLGGRRIHEIKRSEIVRLLDDVETKRGPRAADEALSVLSIVYGWAVLRHENLANPIIKSMRRTTPKDRLRTRVLSDDELRAVWRAAEKLGTFGAYVRLLLLTGCRRNELARARWDEIAGDVVTIPAARFKSGRDHAIPLSRAARELLAQQPEIAGCPYIFTTDGRRPIGGFSRFKAKLDKASGVTGWRFHDLRRVARSLLSRAGVSADIGERALGHTVGGALRQTYDQHRYVPELAHAFERLAGEIERIVNTPEGGNVVEMRRG